MSAFTGPLRLEHMDADWRLWRLLEPLSYDVGYLGSGQTITVPVGFVTDGASVPRPLWWLLPTWGRYSRAAALHDYTCARIRDGNPHAFAPDHKTSDAIFLESMKVCGVKSIARYPMWAAVRLWSLFR